MTSAILVGSEDVRLTELLSAEGLQVRSVPEDGVSASVAKAGADALVVVDLHGEASIPGWLPAFRMRHPSAPVLVVLPELNSTLILEAMRAGANECVAQTLADQDLHAAVDRLRRLLAPTAAGQVFAFLGAKGGVGTTTTAVNVATALDQHHRASTLLIDLHLAHGDAAVFLGVEPRFSVVDALENMNRLDPTYFGGLISKPKAGPHLLASSDRVMVGAAAVQHIRQLVEFASRQYRYTVLDVPMSEASTIDALDLATRIVVVANQELPTVRNASRIAEALRRRYGRERVSVIITRYDSAAEIGQDDVERVTGVSVTGTIPSDYRLALQALNAGRPLMIENHSKLAASFRLLATQLAGKQPAPPKQEDAVGLLGRLLGRRS